MTCPNQTSSIVIPVGGALALQVDDQNCVAINGFQAGVLDAGKVFLVGESELGVRNTDQGLVFYTNSLGRGSHGLVQVIDRPTGLTTPLEFLIGSVVTSIVINPAPSSSIFQLDSSSLDGGDPLG